MSTLEQRVFQVISEQLNIDVSKIKLDSELVKDLGADSLDNVELLMAFEEAFDIVIPDDVAENMRTVRDVYELVSEKADAVA